MKSEYDDAMARARAALAVLRRQTPASAVATNLQSGNAGLEEAYRLRVTAAWAAGR